MTLEKIEKRIENLLTSDNRWPIVVDFSNKADMKEFLYHFSVGENKILSAGDFCGKDGTLKFEELSNRIEKNDSVMFLINLTGYLKLCGEEILKNTLKTIISKSITGHVIIITYQCRNYLKFSDSRFAERGQILIVDGEFDNSSNICLISPELEEAFLNAYIGFEKIGEAYDNCYDNIIYVATDVSKKLFNLSLINISQLNNGYDILCAKDSRIKNVPESFGSPSQWNGLLKDMGKFDFAFVAEELLGPSLNLVECVKQYPSYSDKLQWLYFIATSIMGAKTDSYVMLAMENATNYKDVPRAVFRTILNINRKDDDFFKLYEERKNVLKYFSAYLGEAVDFCKIVSSKQEDAIYYLTDIFQPEKEKMIEWLDIYGCKYTTDELDDIFKNIAPDIAAYLSKYRFKNDFLNDYFEKYKYQKLINKLLPEFKEIVEKQATELEFVSLLKPRTQLFDKIDLKHTRTYFVDALGVEYLGFIQSKCNEYGLFADIMCGRCELPSLTCFNKDFVNECNEKGCPISDIKELDEIKHHGEDGFDYEKTKTPIYLLRELEIIDNLLRNIQAAILNNNYEKAIIVSDHGASRLAVLNETENIWEMETKGVHSGRCCPKNEINEKPSFAIEESDYWVLANYDRFKGSRKANVEVHGGATLEEVTIPIIAITRCIDGIESFILDECKVITLSAMEIPILKVYVGTISDSITIKVDDKFYDAEPTADKYVYEAKMKECTKKGKYSADILNGSNVLSSGNVFEIDKKGMKEVSLFD
ncbi:hypothetical protein SAMN04487760_10565 [Lachnospiraceae bacterium G41]|nr:hypothetical protein SAMN04487760_10565 [Lachnospiraceae bacterium G41]